MTDAECPFCGDDVEVELAGTSPHIETGDPVEQLRCTECGEVGDKSEFSPPADGEGGVELRDGEAPDSAGHAARAAEALREAERRLEELGLRDADEE